jgi:RimJ/RimL family protein N-acetyltransferase
METIRLVPINEAGVPVEPIAIISEVMRQNCMATASFYKVVGFEPPWIGYVSVAQGRPVGGGGFKGPPRDNRVEIAYYTLPEFEGRGLATATASELIRIAKSTAPAILVVAQTLPVFNASNALLKKLGFLFHGTMLHPEDGEVWEWQLNAQQDAPPDARNHSARRGTSR